MWVMSGLLWSLFTLNRPKKLGFAGIKKTEKIFRKFKKRINRPLYGVPT